MLENPKFPNTDQAFKRRRSSNNSKKVKLKTN